MSREEPLSNCEQKVMDYICEGHQQKEISGIMGITLSTVHTYVQRARLKLGARTVPEAAVKHRERLQRHLIVDYDRVLKKPG